MAHRFTIVGIGEALFDVLPEGSKLGGAPLNVAVHAQQLIGRASGRGVAVSRVGQDALGDELIAAVREHALDPAFIQTDPDRPTGEVYVDLDADGQPTYDIVRDVAWDVLQWDPDLEDLAKTCQAVCFGSLAQRDGQSRNTIYRFLAEARRAIRLFDVNLRQDYFDQRALQRSCELATMLKLNQEELARVAGMLVPESLGSSEAIDEAAVAEALRQAFGLEMVIVTRGEQGTAAATEQGWFTGEPASADMAENADAVGAGDSVSAAILTGRLLRWPVAKTLTFANKVGAFVPSQHGATPVLPEELLSEVGPAK